MFFLRGEGFSVPLFFRGLKKWNACAAVRILFSTCRNVVCFSVLISFCFDLKKARGRKFITNYLTIHSCCFLIKNFKERSKRQKDNTCKINAPCTSTTTNEAIVNARWKSPVWPCVAFMSVVIFLRLFLNVGALNPHWFRLLPLILPIKRENGKQLVLHHAGAQLRSLSLSDQYALRFQVSLSFLYVS